MIELSARVLIDIRDALIDAWTPMLGSDVARDCAANCAQSLCVIEEGDDVELDLIEHLDITLKSTLLARGELHQDDGWCADQGAAAIGALLLNALRTEATARACYDAQGRML